MNAANAVLTQFDSQNSNFHGWPAREKLKNSNYKNGNLKNLTGYVPDDIAYRLQIFSLLVGLERSRWPLWKNLFFRVNDDLRIQANSYTFHVWNQAIFDIVATTFYWWR